MIFTLLFIIPYVFLGDELLKEVSFGNRVGT
jgi:hypothetical protein